MVDLYTSYSVVNKSLANLAGKINKLDKSDDIRIQDSFVRLEEEDTYITERSNRLASNLTAAYNLASFRKNFYMLESDGEDDVVFKRFIDAVDFDIDMSEFNMEVDDSGYKSNNF